MGKILWVNASILSILVASSACTLGRTSGDANDNAMALGTASNDGSSSAPVTKQIVVLSSPTVAAADGNAPTNITLQVTDSAGLPLANQTVILAPLRPGDTVSPQTAITDIYGRVTVALTAQTLGASGIVAQSGSVRVTSAINFIAESPALSACSWTAQPGDTLADGKAIQRLVLNVRDGAGRNVPNAGFSVTSTVKSDVLVPFSAHTDGLGNASVTLTGTSAGLHLLAVTLSSGTLVTQANFVSGLPDAGYSLFTVNPATLVADGSIAATLNFTARDAFGNIVSGATATFSGDASDAIEPASVVTDQYGIAMAQVRSTHARTATLTAQTSSSTNHVNVVWVAGESAMAYSYLISSPSVTAADGVSQNTVTLVVRDAFANPVPGQVVLFSAGGNNTQIAHPIATTDALGTASAAITSTTAETKPVSATTAGLALNGTVTFVAGAPNAALSALSISPTVAVGQAVNLSAHVVDSYGNPLVDVPVLLNASGGNTTFVPGVAAVTDGSGYFSGTALSLPLQTEQLTITIGGLSLSSNVTFAAGPASMAQSSFVATPNAAVAAGGTAQAIYTLTVRDSIQHPEMGLGATFSTMDDFGAIIQTAGVICADGTLSTALTSLLAGPRSILARAGGLNFSGQTVFVPQAPLCSSDLMLGGRPVSLTNTTGTGVTTSVVAMDINGDGHADVVLAGTASPGLTSFMGDGNGSFQQGVSLPTTGAPAQVMLVDLDTDSYKDAVVAADGNYISYYTGSAHGPQGAATVLSANGNIVGLCAADLNGDMITDIVAVSSGNPAGFTVFFGNTQTGPSAGTFYPSSGSPRYCAAADFNDDGLIDIAISNSDNGTVDCYMGNGAHDFSTVSSVSVGGKPSSMVAGLFDSDTYADVAVIDSQNSKVIILTGGASGITQSAFSTTLAGTTLGDIAARDMNGDGNVDLILSSGLTAPNTTTTPQGLRPNSLVLMLNGGGELNFTKSFLGAHGAATSVTAADFNEDGVLDIAYTLATSSGASITFGQTPGVFDGNGPYATVYAGTDAAVGDFDQDGHLDLVSVSSTGGNGLMWLGLGDGNFAAPQMLPTGTATWVTAADVDGDGLLDLLLTPAAEGASAPFLVVMRGSGHGQFSMSAFSAAAGTQFSPVIVGDINGDGLADAVNTGAGSQVFGALSVAGNTLYTNASFSYGAYGSNCVPGAIADFTGDGFNDLALVCSAVVLIYPGTPNGLSSIPTTFNVASTTGYGVHAAQARALDFTGDGNTDLIITTADGAIYPFVNVGSGSFAAAPGPSAVLNGTAFITVSDLNQDGFADIIQPRTPGYAVFLGNGSGGFSAPRSYPGGITTRVVVSDFNHDGRRDLMSVTSDIGLVRDIAQGCVP